MKRQDAMDVELRAEVLPDGLVLHIAGELTGPNVGEFKNWIQNEIDEAEGPIRVNCSKLHFIDSSGLGAFIFLQKKLEDRGLKLILCEVSGWLRKFLQVTGLEEALGAKPEHGFEGNTEEATS